MKNVIITGAANGVGKAIADLLKNENLILLDIDEDNLKDLSKKINARCYVCDISNDEEILKTINCIKEEYEKIDCLINCAGMWISGDMSKTEELGYKEMNDLNRVKKVIDTNVFGTIAMIKTIFPIMKKFVFDLPHEITIPSIEVRHIKNY